MTLTLFTIAVICKGWHEVLGHCNYEDILKLKDAVEGMIISGCSCIKSQDCNVCIEGKMTQSRNRNLYAHATKPLELVHTDLAGPIDPASGFQIFRSFYGWLFRSKEYS